ncbi:hypothetical protein FGO68_gene16343 [Halteria grandinella]|uniref:Uncharacterized protein n=1 Tax=Halteria grandinella TaxID=5974 RepID=A0A8J8SUQ4_HALGN|nr:hypothetical protein FGO68_gene16343 [Halteria grandinella]
MCFKDIQLKILQSINRSVFDQSVQFFNRKQGRRTKFIQLIHYKEKQNDDYKTLISSMQVYNFRAYLIQK